MQLTQLVGIPSNNFDMRGFAVSIFYVAFFTFFLFGHSISFLGRCNNHNTLQDVKVRSSGQSCAFSKHIVFLHHYYSICLLANISKKRTIHGFAISVPVLILSIFWQMLLRNGKLRVNVCFETSEHAVQTADNNSKFKQLSYYTASTWYYILI